MLRLGVVAYLNARPLVFGLDRDPGRFRLRFDVPAECARLLHARQVDLGTIPSIEYVRGAPLSVVPDIAIGCDGPIESVAIFATQPLERIRTIALDASSRTSVVLARVLCARHFGIAPAFREMPQDAAAMLRACDAAVVIGDAALFFDHAAAGACKIDLGAAWRAWTGLPFVFAFWAGYPGSLGADDVARLQAARDAALEAPDRVAAAFFPGNALRAATGARYLRDNVKYGFSEREKAGVTRFFEEAAALGLVPASRDLRYFDGPRRA